MDVGQDGTAGTGSEEDRFRVCHSFGSHKPADTLRKFLQQPRRRNLAVSSMQLSRYKQTWYYLFVFIQPMCLYFGMILI